MAGFSPTWLEKVRFTELLSNSDLITVEGQKESVMKGIIPSKTCLIKFKTKEYRQATILSSSPFESIFIDRNILSKEYKESGSLTQAILQSLYTFSPMSAEYLTLIGKPNHPEIMRKYKKFQKEFKLILKERNKYISKRPFLAYYNKIASKKELSAEQLEHRELLLEEKELNPELFNRYWKDGEYHKSTIISRLKDIQLPEAKILAKLLSKNISIPVEDYGFVDQEIISGLSHIQTILEKNLIICFWSGHPKFMEMCQLYEKKDKLNPNQLKTITIYFNLMATKKEYKDMTKIEEILSL